MLENIDDPVHLANVLMQFSDIYAGQREKYIDMVINYFDEVELNNIFF